jgi:hypothetical protein
MKQVRVHIVPPRHLRHSHSRLQALLDNPRLLRRRPTSSPLRTRQNRYCRHSCPLTCQLTGKLLSRASCFQKAAYAGRVLFGRFSKGAIAGRHTPFDGDHYGYALGQTEVPIPDLSPEYTTDAMTEAGALVELGSRFRAWLLTLKEKS